MQIKVTRGDSSFTLDIPDDLTIYELADELKKILYILGYSIENINELFSE